MASISKERFAKIIEVDGCQVLIRKDATGEGLPSIVASCLPEGLGICSLQFSYDHGKGDLDNVGLRDKAFRDIDEGAAKNIVDGVINMIEKNEQKIAAASDAIDEEE